MSKDTVSITITGDANDAIKEYDRLRKKQEAVDAAVETTTQKSKTASQKWREHQRTARTALKETETEVEQLERKLDELHAAYKAGAVDTKSYERQQTRLNKQLDQSRGKTGRFGGAIGSLRGGVTKLTGSLGGSVGGLSSLASGAGIATGVIAALTASVLKAKEANDKFLEKEGQTYVDIDKQVTEFMIQGGRKKEDRHQITDQFLNIAEANKADLSLVTKAAKSFESSGLSGSEQNGMLDLYVKAAQSATATEVDPQEIIKPIAQFLEATGQDMSAENFSDILMRGRGLYSEGAFEFSDLDQVAKIAPGMTDAGIAQEETLAVFASLRQSLSAETAATGAKNVVGTLKSAAGEKSKVDALANIGLSADDVDLVGESLEESMTRLATALDSVDKQTRNVTIAKLFGRESSDAAIKMMDSYQSGDVAKRRFLQTDTEGFQRGIDNAQSGAAAADREAYVKEQRTDIRRRSEAMQKRLTDQAKERMNQRAMQNATSGGAISDMWFGVDEWLRQSTRGIRETFTGDTALPQSEIADVRDELNAAGLPFDESKVVDINSGSSLTPGLEERYRDDTKMDLQKTNELLEQLVEKTDNARKPVPGVQRSDAPDFQPTVERKPMPLANGGAFGGNG